MKNRQKASGLKQSVPIDWAQIHRRLETVRESLDQGRRKNPEEEKEILRSRAKLLAQEEEKIAHEKGIETVEFVLSYENYGLESSYIREVYPMKDLMPLPCTPPFVLGIINVRGQILPVIDLKKLFDLPEKGLTDLNKVIIVSTSEMEFGILADAVLGARRIRLREIQPLPPTLTGTRAEYLRGVTKERLIVLNVEKLISNKALIVFEEA